MDEYTQPDYNNIALITIDLQNDFCLPGAALEIKGTMEIIPNAVQLLKLFRKCNKPIIHIVRLYEEDGSNVDAVRRKWIHSGIRAAAPFLEGAELVKDLKPNNTRLDSAMLLQGGIQEIASHEFVIYKSRWGAFYNTPLETFLKEKHITTLAFTGCNFPNCPRTSIYEASERDFRIVVIQDAISGIYEHGLQELSHIGCEVIGTQDFLSKFDT